jgi:glycosyltransferase involved in cell wall biosynthesis
MPTFNETESRPDTAQRRDEIVGRPSRRNLRVYMMDLWSFIPYYMARLCASLPAQAVDVTLGTVRYHLDRDYFRKAGVPPDRFLIDAGGGIKPAFARRLVKSCEYLLNLSVLGLRLLFSRPDILHVQYLPFLERGLGFELWLIKWSRWLGIRVVYTVHNVTRQDAPGQGRPLFRRAYSLADALICHGDAARTELTRDFQIAANKIWVIPHGPLFDEGPSFSIREARSILNLPLENPLVLCLGVISQYKGIPFLLDAWKRVQKEGSQARLLIAGTGDPSVLADIRQAVERDGLEATVDLRLQFIPVEQMPLFYQAADILVYPYKAGTTSGALLTGLNYHKAVVATKLPFFEEHLKDGETALLADYGDVESWCSALRAVIDDPQERARIASSLRPEASGGMDWEEIARKTEECYKAALGKSRR